MDTNWNLEEAEFYKYLEFFVYSIPFVPFASPVDTYHTVEVYIYFSIYKVSRKVISSLKSCEKPPHAWVIYNNGWNLQNSTSCHLIHL